MKDRRADNQDRLLQIRNAIKEIESFVSEVSADEFNKDSLISSAVLFQFSVIGEAVSHLDKDLLNKYEYPWYKVRAFRNLISHEYFQIELRVVWEVIVRDLPGLGELTEMILDEAF
ncbi:DUF86 domain-containing protein [Bacteroidota bacterium]